MRRALVPNVFIPAVLFLAVAVLPGCTDDGASKGLENEVTDLRGQLKKTTAENEKLSRRLDETERRLRGLQEDLLTSRNASAAAAPGAAAAEVPTEAAPAEVLSSPDNPALAADAKKLADVLGTDDGIKVLEGAIKTIERRREEERTARMVQGLVDAFAQKASLTPQQAESMQKIALKSATATRELWSALRDAGEMTAEQRNAMRIDLLAKGEEIRVRTDDEVRGVLDARQFEIYKQDSERLRGAFRGMGGAGGQGFPGGAGGRGGRGGDDGAR